MASSTFRVKSSLTNRVLLITWRRWPSIPDLPRDILDGRHKASRVKRIRKRLTHFGKALTQTDDFCQALPRPRSISSATYFPMMRFGSQVTRAEKS